MVGICCSRLRGNVDRIGDGEFSICKSCIGKSRGVVKDGVMLDVGYWTLNTRYWMQRVGCLKFLFYLVLGSWILVLGSYFTNGRL
jgi:hypothetical protein